VKFIDETSQHDLAQSSTILQCMVHMVDFECNKFHIQAELVGAENGTALIDCDPLTHDQIIDVCNKVNKHFVRKDGSFSCKPKENFKTFVVCEATGLEGYSQLA
jgi:hypothetical protein